MMTKIKANGATWNSMSLPPAGAPCAKAGVMNIEFLLFRAGEIASPPKAGGLYPRTSGLQTFNRFEALPQAARPRIVAQNNGHAFACGPQGGLYDQSVDTPTRRDPVRDSLVRARGGTRRGARRVQESRPARH